MENSERLGRQARPGLNLAPPVYQFWAQNRSANVVVVKTEVYAMPCDKLTSKIYSGKTTAKRNQEQNTTSERMEWSIVEREVKLSKLKEMGKGLRRWKRN